MRKRHPYAVYGKVDFEEVLFTEGDCLARYMVRMREIEQSMHIIEQLIDNIPEGEYQLKMKPVIRIPEGSYYAAVEGSRGEFGVFIESRGDKFPYRMKFRSTGLPLVSCLETIARGTKIADLIAIGGTLDYVVPNGVFAACGVVCKSDPTPSPSTREGLGAAARQNRRFGRLCHNL